MLLFVDIILMLNVSVGTYSVSIIDYEILVALKQLSDVPNTT